MELRFERTIAASPELLWSELCEPEKMARWSLAKVDLRSPGQSNHPGGPGAHRRVTLSAGGTEVVLDEVIRDSVPGELLIYQVVDNAFITKHLGTIRLRSAGSNTFLDWHVEFECSAPGLASVITRQLRAKLGTSLDRLKQQLESNPQQRVSTPSWKPLPSPPVDVWTRAERVHTALLQHATKLAGAGDPKRVFPQIYSFVSEGILTACHKGDFVYPTWPLHLLPVFYEYYQRNYERWCDPRLGPVESHWIRAFSVLDGHSPTHKTEAARLLGGLSLAVHAHVESDLPRSLAEVYVDNFAKYCDYSRFRGDYYSMGDIFVQAFRRVLEVIPTSSIPAWARVAKTALPAPFMQQLAYRKAYDLPKYRRAAFRRGAEIAEMLQRRQSDAQAFNQ